MYTCMYAHAPCRVGGCSVSKLIGVGLAYIGMRDSSHGFVTRLHILYPYICAPLNFRAESAVAPDACAETVHFSMSLISVWPAL